MNSTEFETAAKRRNCTKGTRYLCAPDKYLLNLIEFCSDITKSLYKNGNLYNNDNDDDKSMIFHFKTTCQKTKYKFCAILQIEITKPLSILNIQDWRKVMFLSNVTTSS